MNSSDFIDRAVDRTLAWAGLNAGRVVSRHPHGLSAAVMLALAGFGATAFGISPLALEQNAPAQHLVTENVTPNAVQAQLDALAEHTLELYRTDLTRSSDTADSLLRRLNVSDPNASVFLRTNPTARQLLAGSGGKMVRVQTDENGKLLELVARYAATDPALASTHFTRLRVTRVDGRLNASITTAPLTSQVRMGRGTVQTSYFAATDAADIPDNVATQLTEVFASQVDFHRQLHKGDSFAVVYEALTADGEPITWGESNAGRVLAAEYTHDGHVAEAMFYQDANSPGGYYDLDGKSMKHAFLPNPLAFSRVTSGFSMRLHPILNTWKQHKGIDFGAPTGTPIRVVGDGTVEFAGWQNGYGNVVEVKHDAGRSTLYAHMSRIDVKAGAHVAQGQRLGAVGMTGWATGPHLHFEFKVDGVQEDPMTIARAAGTTELAPSSKAHFAQLAHSAQGLLDAADSMVAGGAYGE